MRYIVLISFYLLSLYGFDFSLSDSTISNGRTIYVEFTKEKDLLLKKIILDKKSYKIFEHPFKREKMYALLPIDYYKKPSNDKAEIIYTKHNQKMKKSFLIKIEDGKYKKETIKVDKSKVNPKSKEVKKRVAKEYAQAMKIYGTVTKQNYIKSKFIAPMDSKITSDFGKARVYNDTLKGYHSGTDYRAKTGTPIIASNSGVVVLVKDRFYSGGTVIIDHGQGIYTCYYHMSKFSVKKGDRVKKAQLLGLSGASGRVTGPHLHFSARVGSKQVDPLQLIELLNKNLF